MCGIRMICNNNGGKDGVYNETVGLSEKSTLTFFLCRIYHGRRKCLPQLGNLNADGEQHSKYVRAHLPTRSTNTTYLPTLLSLQILN